MKFAVASDLGIYLSSVSDLSDALSACMKHGGLILTQSELAPAFFDLRTGFAGEVLQKFVNYHAKLAIIVEQADCYGDRFNELMREHRTHPLVRFYASRADAEAWLGRPGP